MYRQKNLQLKKHNHVAKLNITIFTHWNIFVHYTLRIKIFCDANNQGFGIEFIICSNFSFIQINSQVNDIAAEPKMKILKLLPLVSKIVKKILGSWIFHPSNLWIKFLIAPKGGSTHINCNNHKVISAWSLWPQN